MACVSNVNVRFNLKEDKDKKVPLQKLRIFPSAKTTFKYLSLAPQAGMPVHTLTTPSLADGLTVPTVGINAFATGAPLIDKVMRHYIFPLFCPVQRWAK
jgi:hypothetical protein